MKKNVGSKISWLLLGLVPLLLIACSGGAAAPTAIPAAEEEPSAPVVEPATEEPSTPVAEPAAVEPTTETMEAVEEPAAEPEAELLPVSAKPQLIEFYADW
jgi:hypothetical protein